MRRNLNKLPIDIAATHYQELGKDFGEVLCRMLARGFVINIPYLFSMGYFYEENGEIICHIVYACGDMEMLLRFGLNYSLDKIEFERNFSGQVKRYDFDKFSKRIKQWLMKV